MSDAFTLRVPADSRFRPLAPDVVGRYVEIAGGSASDREAAVRAVTEALDQLGASSDDHVDLVCTPLASGVEVTIRCGGRQSVVQHPLPAGKR
jgi:hypothetical protein